MPGLFRPDHVAGVGVFDHLAVLAEQFLGRGEPDSSGRCGQAHGHVLGESWAGADPHEGDPVAVAGSHVGLELEHQSR